MRSAKPMTRSNLCSAITTVRLKSCTKRCKIERTSSAAIGSKALVGSSKTKTLGWATNAVPMATLCCSPPLNVAITLFRSGAKLNKSKTSSTLFRITSLGRFNASMPKASSSSTVSATKPFAGFCPTMPMRWAMPPGFTN